MTEANYDKHMLILGKFCHLFDTAAVDETAQLLLVSVTMDQIAVGTTENAAAEAVFSQNHSQWLSNISSGPTALKNRAITMATQYMRTADFTGDITTSTVTTSSSIGVIIAALAADSVADDLTGGTGSVVAGAVGDGNIYDIETTTGFVHFFEEIGGNQTWGTNADPSIVDATYVVATAV